MSMVRVLRVALLGKDHRKVEVQGVKDQQKDQNRRMGYALRMVKMSRSPRSFLGLFGVKGSESKLEMTRLSPSYSRPILEEKFRVWVHKSAKRTNTHFRLSCLL